MELYLEAGDNMLKLLKKLKPYNKSEITEYKELLKELKYDNGHYFWYLSSGLDFKPLVYFNKIDTKKYKTPTIDFFIYSDYSKNVVKEINRIYDEENFKIYKDDRTNIEITQMIPLYYYNNDEIKEIIDNDKKCHHSFSKIINTPQFYFMMIEIESSYFGNEYFPVLYACMENLELKKILQKSEIKLDYICAICDGCRKGGAIYCCNKEYKKFTDIMNDRKFWITDHFEYKDQEKFRIKKHLYRAKYGEAKLYKI